MSAFGLKMVALLAMTCDHLGLVLGRDGWGLLPLDSTILRAIGRMAFPLFAFCLAQGWQQTRNRKRYFQNLLWGALVSQLPFSMAFAPSNLTAVSTDATQACFAWPFLIGAAVAVGAYWLLVLHRHYDHSLLLVAMAALVPGLRLQIRGVCLLGENANVFYTFLMAFFCLYLLTGQEALSREERIAAVLAAPVLLIAYGLPADYGTGLLGIVLIVGFVLLKRKAQQLAFLALWSFLYYGLLVGNPRSMVCCALAGGVLLLYDPQAQSRFRAKRFFYGYYPAHLLALGLLNFAMRG